MTIKELAHRAKAINIPALKQQAVSNKSALIVDLQRRQLRQGKDADNKTMRSYPAGYAAFKETLSTYMAPPGVPDLYLTGSFQRGIHMKLSGDDYKLDSTDSKTAKLEGKYGHIFDLNQTTLPQAQVNVTNEFNSLTKTALGL